MEYFKNMESLNFDRKIDENNFDDTSLPIHPARVLCAHVAQKGIQGGAVGGILIGVPLISFLRKIPLRTAWSRVMVSAPIIGSFVTLSMLHGLDYSKPMGIDGVDDRAYRIMHNQGQVKVDKYSTVGAAVGAGIGAVSLAGMSAVVAGASTGVAVGVLYYCVEKEGWLKQLKDIKMPEL